MILLSWWFIPQHKGRDEGPGQLPRLCTALNVLHVLGEEARVGVRREGVVAKGLQRGFSALYLIPSVTPTLR